MREIEEEVRNFQQQYVEDRCRRDIHTNGEDV